MKFINEFTQLHVEKTRVQERDRATEAVQRVSDNGGSDSPEFPSLIIAYMYWGSYARPAKVAFVAELAKAHATLQTLLEISRSLAFSQQSSQQQPKLNYARGLLLLTILQVHVDKLAS